MVKLDENKKIISRKNKDLIFYILMMAFPVLQFCVFYIGVNFNSILLSFKEIDILSGDVRYTFDNFKEAFRLITESSILVRAMGNSFYIFFLGVVISVPLGLFFSYYIAKKMPGSGAFRVILFLPSILSSIVIATIFWYFVERAVPSAMFKWFGVEMAGMLENPETRFATLIFYSIWIGFGTNVLMYTNAMSGIEPSVIESAHLDGATGFREFWHITLPMIYPTLTTFLVVSVAGIFVNQLNLFSFYGGAAPEEVRTYGYYLYAKVASATSDADYPVLSAMGLILSCIAVPLTLVAKKLLEKYGPREE